MTLLERNLRLELSQLDPMEALFKLTTRIAQATTQLELMNGNFTVVEVACINIYKALSKELV